MPMKRHLDYAHCRQLFPLRTWLSQPAVVHRATWQPSSRVETEAAGTQPRLQTTNERWESDEVVGDLCGVNAAWVVGLYLLTIHFWTDNPSAVYKKYTTHVRLTRNFHVYVSSSKNAAVTRTCVIAYPLYSDCRIGRSTPVPYIRNIQHTRAVIQGLPRDPERDGRMKYTGYTCG